MKLVREFRFIDKRPSFKCASVIENFESFDDDKKKISHDLSNSNL